MGTRAARSGAVRLADCWRENILIIFVSSVHAGGSDCSAGPGDVWSIQSHYISGQQSGTVNSELIIFCRLRLARSDLKESTTCDRNRMSSSGGVNILIVIVIQ